MENKTLENLGEYDLGTLLRLDKLENGLINLTLKAETDLGKFIIQRLSPIWDERVISDYSEVQHHLRTNGLFVPVLLRTKSGKSFHTIDDKIWRVYEYVPNDLVITPTPQIAYESGKMLGRFHNLMSTSSFRPKFKLKDFHNTPKIIDRLSENFKNPEYREKASSVSQEYELITQNIREHYLSQNANQIVIHGDPKLNNFLFKDERAIGMLDLDTMMHASPLLDLGDGLRSWCRKKPSTSEFLPEIFESAVEGYFSTAPFQYCFQGVKNAMGLLTLELSSRYLNDYFEESYFPLNKEKYSSKAEQNLTRAKRYLDYYKNFNT
ncbi:hypothetical protein COU54_02005 [Candidatus Pacearchaeota archaeon CG10_big_fil_rev_8_21_14_0_10_31_24]|nr:MAG: hypothetical protein COU54_02005 [Candidatus Pacearchaeota archaeon CG10_big_fil_rev_8_21_14_0_10_31_24]